MGIAFDCRNKLLPLLTGAGIEFTEDGEPIRPQSLCVVGTELPQDIQRSGLDYVAFVHQLEHISDPTEVLSKAWSMVRPGGTFLLVLPDSVLYPGPGDRGNPDHKVKYDIKGTYDLLSRIGFRYTPISQGLIEPARSLWVAVTRFRSIVEAPRYCVVIPSYGRWDLTEQCVRSIEDAGWNPESIILVDDGSPDPMPCSLSERPNVYPLFRMENGGFPAAVNAGVEAAPGGDPPPFVIILNNDVTVHNGGDTTLLAPLSDPRVAVAGPSGASLNDRWEYDGKGTDYIEFHCAAVRRSIWNELGGLDSETFGMGYGEDSDYCIRARRAGYKLVVTGDACTHKGGQTFETIPDKRELIDRNRRSLIRKHRKGRVIWAVASLSTSGGIRVIWNCAKAMRDAGWETHMVLTNPNEALQGPLPAPWNEFHMWDINVVKTAADPFDIAIGTFWSTWEHVAKIPAKRRIGFVQSDEPEWYQDTAQRARALLNFTLPGFEHIVISERMLEFEQKYGHNVIGVAQNGVDSLVYTPLWSRPSRESAEWSKRWPHRVMVVRKGGKTWFDGQEFADHAMIKLGKKIPDLEYVVVGGDRVPATGVKCPVENVTTYNQAEMATVYNRVGVYVIPSKIEGSSLTVLEAMACGAPVICTEIASDVVVDRRNALVVPYGDANAIAKAVNQIFSDGSLRWRLYYEGLRTTHERTLERQRAQFLGAIE